MPGQPDALQQSASVYGIYGLGLWALLSAVPAGLSGGSFLGRLACGISAAALIFLHIGYGSFRLSTAASPVTDLGFRLVQANIPQREKWALQYRARNIMAHYQLSREDRPDWVRRVIWPEMAATIYLAEDSQARQVLAGAVPGWLAADRCAPRREAGIRGSYNSILALDEGGEIIGHYDKAHVVAVRRIYSIRIWLQIEKITDGVIGYRPGPGVRTVRLPGLPAMSLLVCYEVFPRVPRSTETIVQRLSST